MGAGVLAPERVSVFVFWVLLILLGPWPVVVVTDPVDAVLVFAEHDLGAACGFDPAATHLRRDLAVAVLPYPTTGPTAQRFWTGHRTRRARVVQQALTTHLAIRDRSLKRML